MKIEPGKSYQIKVEVSDYNGNKSYLEAYITGTEQIEMKLSKKNFLDPNKDYFFDLKNKTAYFPKNSFFDSIPLLVENQDGKLIVGENIYPLQKSFEVSFEIPKKDSIINRQSFIAMLNSKEEPYFFSNKKKEGKWIGKSKTLGTFIISRDSLAPIIKPLNFKKNQWISSLNYLKINLTDDYSGIKSFRGEINGKWILFEYEPKNNSLIYDLNDLSFDEDLHRLTLEAEDMAGNLSKLEMDLYRKKNKKVDEANKSK